MLTRDGTSSYYINNQPVRRRDVQDVFLGTGLGPRAYAIIGQGTISRIIESKPEELRLFLEEAAGVSKYKERRRETENRLKDTRENLTRVEDILRELNANLEKLEAQAEVARRYRALQARRADSSCTSCGSCEHRDAASEEERVSQAVAEATSALEAQTAELRHVEAELETCARRTTRASDALHAAQGALAEAALEVSRLEERIRYVVEGRAARSSSSSPSCRRRARSGERRERRREAELARIAGQIEAAERAGRSCSARAGRGAAERLARRSKTRCARAQSRSSEQRSAGRRGAAADPGARRPRAATSTSSGASCDARRDRLGEREARLAAPDAAAARRAARAAGGEAEAKRKAVAEARLHELQRAGAGARRASAATRRSSVNAEAAQAAPSWSARLDALRALQEKVQTEGKLKPWLAQPRPRRPAGPVDTDPHRGRLGNRARGGAARARWARSRSAGSTPCARLPPTRRRRGWRSTRRRGSDHAHTHRTPAAPGRPAAPERRRACRRCSHDWLEGVYTAERSTPRSPRAPA